MHVIYVGYAYDAGLRSEAELLEACPTIPAFAGALAGAGAAVTVLQRFSLDGQVEIGATRMVFLRDGLPPRPQWEIPWRVHKAICELARRVEDPVIHLNGLVFGAQVCALREQLPRTVPIVVQHHAERPCSGIKRALQSYALRAADGFFFASSALAQDWIAKGVISSRQPVYEVMESPVTLAVSGDSSRVLHGDPVFLWVGRLNAAKDPVTVLTAFERAVQRVPSARLYMLHTGGELAATVRERIVASEALQSSVAMLGAIPHHDLPRMYASADFFVAGSHYEGSGYALAEAMAHGVVPVIPRIPSFSTMASGAARFWSAGDANDCARAMLEAMSSPIAVQRQRVRRQYSHFLSPEAIGRAAIGAYAEIIDRRRART